MVIIPDDLLAGRERVDGPANLLTGRERLILDLSDLSIRPAPDRPATEPPVIAGDRLRHEKPLELGAAVRFNAIEALTVETVGTKPQPMDRVRQRIETLCLDGMCGFVRRNQRHVDGCLARPDSRSCAVLRPLCDPRVEVAPLGCASPPADYRDSGVFAIWAEGATVRVAEAIRLLRQGTQKWVPLRGGERLIAGDLLYLPINGRLEVENDGVIFGDRSAEDARKAGIDGHLIAIVGEGSQRRLLSPDAPAALSPAAVIAGSETMRFQSGALFGREFERSVGYGARPLSRRELTLKEIGDQRRLRHIARGGRSGRPARGIPDRPRPEGAAAPIAEAHNPARRGAYALDSTIPPCRSCHCCRS